MNEELQGTVQLPAALGEYARQVDSAYYLVFWVSVAFTVAIFGAMIFYILKYQRKEGVKAKPTGHSTVIEIAWTFAPLILLAYFFHVGWQGFLMGAVAPEDAIDIRVTGKKWSWDFNYPGGLAGEPGQLVVPAGEPVRLVMSSQDVIHSFFIPTMRAKRDVVPGMYTTMWFEADQATPEQTCEVDADCPVGFRCTAPLDFLYSNPDAEEDDRQPYRSSNTCEAAVFCTEYCGTDHSAMLATIHIVPPEVYEGYVRIRRDALDRAPEICRGQENENGCWGQLLYTQQGCNACHGIDGEQSQPAPNWVGLWDNQRQFADGTAATADENYIQNSIRNPGSQVVSGYNPIMPAYPNLTEAQLTAIITYMQAIQEGPADLVPEG